MKIQIRNQGDYKTYFQYRVWKTGWFIFPKYKWTRWKNIGDKARNLDDAVEYVKYRLGLIDREPNVWEYHV